MYFLFSRTLYKMTNTNRNITFVSLQSNLTFSRLLMIKKGPHGLLIIYICTFCGKLSSYI